MTSLQLVVPLGVAVLLGVVVTATHRRMRPSQASPLLTATIVAVALAAVPAVTVIAIGYLIHASMHGGLFETCHNAMGLHALPPWLGLPAVGVLTLAVVRAVRVIRSWRAIRRVRSEGLQVVTSDAWFAYTLPGPAGQIVLSSTLVDALDSDELEVVLSHERAHVDHRHDRYILVGDVANALVPIVRPLRQRLLFSLERWADEAAVTAVTGDRAIVARTVARVALAHVAGPAPATGLARLGVAARVEALYNPPRLYLTRGWVTATTVGSVAVLAAAGVQLHHLAALFGDLSSLTKQPQDGEVTHPAAGCTAWGPPAERSGYR